jgi:hypothetical protein
VRVPGWSSAGRIRVITDCHKAGADLLNRDATRRSEWNCIYGGSRFRAALTRSRFIAA